MPYYAVNDVAAYGIITDRAPKELPPGAWTAGQNVRFVDSVVEVCGGELSSQGTSAVRPYHILSATVDSIYRFWVYAGLAKVYVADGISPSNITRQTTGSDVDYAATAAKKWTSTILGSVPVLNNSVDPPQMWLPTSSGQRLQELSNWPANTTCSSLRSLKNFLVALDVTKSGVRYPTLVKWSHEADPGAVPVTWDGTDPAHDAGEFPLGQTQGACVDLVPLRDGGIVYKTDAVWGMQYVGGVFVFRFYPIFGTFGIPNKNCAIEFQPGKHFLYTGDDIVVHDGVTVQSLLSTRRRKELVSVVLADGGASFVATNPIKDEVWFCFSDDSNQPNLATRAFVWNWRFDTWGDRDLSNSAHIAVGPVDPAIGGAATTWASDSASWASDTTAWYAEQALAFSRLLSAQTNLTELETGLTISGTPQTAYIERVGIGIPFEVDSPPDISTMKFCRAVYPRIAGTSGGVVYCEIGKQMEVGGPITWESPQPYTIDTTVKINCRVSGRLFALRFSSSSAITWRLLGYEMDVDFIGKF